jgi:protein-S-isoprenylcysteine O-methyltransferase Ste14
MSTARYVIGVMLVMTVPPGILLWFAIHPFARLWRRVGPVWTYVMLTPFVIAWMLLAFANRELLVGLDLGTHLYLLVPTGVCVLAGTVVAAKRRRQLSSAIVVGVPELSPRKHPGRLITTGIYARIRHPRYVEIVLFTAAYAFFANHVGVYVTTVLTFVALYFVVLLEERELRDRFGDAYEEYCRRVRRFLPLRVRACKTEGAP